MLCALGELRVESRLCVLAFRGPWPDWCCLSSRLRVLTRVVTRLPSRYSFTIASRDIRVTSLNLDGFARSRRAIAACRGTSLARRADRIKEYVSERRPL